MRPRGFTLLELLIVLGIAALVVAVVGSRADVWMDRAAYHQSVRDVATLLKAGRMSALQNGREVDVRLDGNRILYVGGDPRRRVALPAEVEVRSEPLVAAAGDAEAPKRDFTPPPLFVFRADGSAYGGRLVLQQGGHGVAFQVNWALGTVEQVDSAGGPT
ncbi:type II secretion system protein H [Tepidimonas thermarum]|uniref:Type II secretion system protein H n=1 Tax=Tepidimonas thermarum TaxID=335431 RepID=A0A554WY99_9BURK|nr:GspH/FimT family pseudopilin [Tepidimonas thermarum]TSE28562.1 type II secretion system protein H [Tepidimonas thermarum]